jgi:homoserine O-acetyltransferase/O-succinyltransferase
MQHPAKPLVAALIAATALASGNLLAAEYPAPAEGEYTIKDFKFTSGETLAELRLHFRTLGNPVRDAQGVVRNAVLIMHGTTGNGGNFIRPEFAGELFGAGQPLDARQFFLVLPDAIGHGQSSKPSDGLHARFPHYGYTDMVEADYRLLTERLGVNHARLIMGTSMGGMHTWVWGERHPDFMDALMPLASLPTQISGRNRMWRRAIIDAIRGDPAWQGGDYKVPPPGLRVAAEIQFFMSSNPVLRYQEAPTLAQADAVLDTYVSKYLQNADANDILYAFEASQDYDPGRDLEKIRAPLLAVNSADDLINPPELGILEREIKRVPHGKAVVIPFSSETVGHGTHTKAAVWKAYLVELLNESAATATTAATTIAPGIYLVPGATPPGVQPDGNSVIIEAPRGLIVFDTGRHAAHTQQLIDFAKAAGRPVTAIINSHWHLDHVGGNGMLRAAYPDVRVYASSALNDALSGFLARYREQLVQAVAQSDKDPAAQASMRTEIALIDAGPALAPTDVVTTSGRRSIAGRKLDLHLEHAAVTAGDVWVFDPKTHVLMSGDLVTLPVPFLDTACPQRWQAALGSLAAIKFNVLIPGHGAPMNRAGLEKYRKAFDGLLACAASEVAQPRCIDDWLRDAGDLVPEGDQRYAKALLGYYLDEVLRGHADQVAKLCSAA